MSMRWTVNLSFKLLRETENIAYANNFGWQTKSIMVCYGIFCSGQLNYTNPDIFETARYRVNGALNQLWKAVSTRCGFGERIHWFRVDERPIHAKI